MKRFMKVISSIVLVVVILTLLGGFSYYFVTTRDVTLSEANLGYKETTTDIYNLNNEIINKSEYVDDYISIEQMPEALANAFISIEDKRFYKHNGLDYTRIAGALLSNIKSRNIKEGASTISQQLIKNTHLTAEKSMSRKIQEARLAMALEKQYEKSEILEMYLNAIYFGNSIYGVQNASQRFFDKDCISLTLSECAMLAGIVKNPSNYSPVTQYNNSIGRRDLVLSFMKEQEMINEEELRQAQSENIVIKYKTLNRSEYRPYIKNTLKQAADILGINNDVLISSNYKIYTYLNNDTQHILADKVYNYNYYKANDNGNLPDGMGIIIDNTSAGITAYSSTSPYSAYEVLRQPGSAIKPISVYIPALQYNIISPATQILDEETTFGDYSPKNYNDKYYGWVSARDAISKSMNIPAVKILSYVGTERSLEYMQKFGFNTVNENSSLSLALGGTHNGASILQMASAYRALADNGTYKEISFIRSISDKDGNLLYSHNAEENKIVNDDNAYLITDMLISTVDNGTASKLNTLPYDIASKTGTVSAANSEYNSDAWSLSYSTENTLCIWQGNLSNIKSKMLDKGITGGSYPTMMARDIYKDMYKNNYPEDFTLPEGIIVLEIDRMARDTDHLLQIASEFTPQEYRIQEIFSINNQPNEISEYFVMPNVDNFRVEFEESSPIIKFIAKKHIKYTIVRESDNVTATLQSIVGNNEEYIFIDVNAPKNSIVKYTVYPSIITDTSEINGNPSNTISILTSNGLRGLLSRTRKFN